MIRLGLTGGIGMGKSTAADYLQRHNLKVVDTDRLARELVEPGQPALAEIRDVFGPQVIAPDGALRRDLLAQRIFTDPALRRRLEEILHPRIRERWRAAVGEWQKAGERVGVVVIPLLFETGAAESFDAVICVACSSATQRLRLQPRGWTETEIFRRNQAQWPVDKKMTASTFVVWSEGTPAAHFEQLDRILQLLGL